MAKVGFTACDACSQKIVHPALLNVDMQYRANLPLGYIEIQVKGDFCDMECLAHYAFDQAVRHNYRVGRTDQSIFYRGEPGEAGQRKNK